jgi:intraflagellar transport protein 172
LKNNRSATLYNTDSYAVSMAASHDSTIIVSGHYDGSIYIYNLETQNYKKALTYKGIPYALGAGKNIVVAGNDQRVSFYDLQGNFKIRHDYSTDDKCRDFTGASVNPNGESIVLGNYNRFYMFNLNQKRDEFEEAGVMDIENYYNITSMCWKSDGSRFITGNLCGSVDMYDISMKKMRYKGKFELNYISPSQVHVLALETGEKSLINSSRGYEITKIKILQDQYVVAHTYITLVIGDLKKNKCSEFEWRGGGNEKFDLTNANVCLIFNAGEVSVIEFGKNDILSTFRTGYFSPSLVSAKLKYGKHGTTKKTIAFLLDWQTIDIRDLSSKTTIATINHDSKIVALELNANANKLLFKDKKKSLYLYDLDKSRKSTLLDFCSFMRWVPESEVIVADNRNSLCVWYSAECPDKVNMYPINGIVSDMKRSPGKTEVTIQEGHNETPFFLDNSLIEFGFALENRELEKCIEILEKQDSKDQEGNWATLANLALEEYNLPVAERCFAALGDIPKAFYLRKINKVIRKYEEETGKNDGVQKHKVQAMLAMLDKQFYRAEAVLLDHNEVEDAMEMYQELHKWEDVIKIAEKINHPDVANLKMNYFDWLITTNQKDKAAELRENEGEYLEAIELYLKAGLPVRAANVVTEYNINLATDVQDKIVNSLIKAELFEKAGEFHERKGDAQKALEYYCKGNVYHKAVDLARRKNPQLVNKLEEKWGDYLVSQNQKEAAIVHYCEAVAIKKAIRTAIMARKWKKAKELLESQPREEVLQYYQKIAEYYDEINQYELAERFYLIADLPRKVFSMYCKAKKFDQAKRVAQENLPREEILELYVSQAKEFEKDQMYKEAEELFLTVKKPELAIRMYQQTQQWEPLIRLVDKFNRDKLPKVHLEIAKQYEAQGKLQKAEHHYLESNYWNLAVDMYESKKMWEECIRVCKSNASDRETVEMAKKWNKDLGEDQFIQMLKKMNLTDALIEYLSDLKQFTEAFKIADKNSRHKKPDVHLKYAFHLEQEKKYKEAEENFIQAGKLDEAISMYTDLGDYNSALRISNQFDPKKTPEILIDYGKVLMKKRDFQKAEKCFIDARRPELAIRMYEEAQSSQDALRVARKHAPNMLNEINKRFTSQSGKMTGEDILRSAKLHEDSRDWDKAINTYLEITSDHYADPKDLEKIWGKAVQLCISYSKDRLQEVTKIVCKRLREVKCFETAGDYFENLGSYENAADCYRQAKQFEKAKACLANVKNPQTYKKLDEIIQRDFKEHIKDSNNPDMMIDHGEVKGGIDLLVNRGDWSQALDAAQKYGAEV